MRGHVVEAVIWADAEVDRYPAFGEKQINQIERKDVIKLLEVEDKCAPSTADLVLMVVRRIMNWHAARDEE